jgi:hypothetical protein
MKALSALILLAASTLFSGSAQAAAPVMTWDEFDRAISDLPAQVIAAGEREHCPVQLQKITDVPAFVNKLKAHVLKSWANSQSGKVMVQLMKDHGNEIMANVEQKCKMAADADGCALQEVVRQFSKELSDQYRNVVVDAADAAVVTPRSTLRMVYQAAFVIDTLMLLTTHITGGPHLLMAFADISFFIGMGTAGRAPEDVGVRGFVRTLFSPLQQSRATVAAARQALTPMPAGAATAALNPFLKKYLHVSDPDFILDQEIVAFKAFNKLSSPYLAGKFIRVISAHPELTEEALYQILLVGLDDSLTPKDANKIVEQIVKSMQNDQVPMPRLLQPANGDVRATN